MSHVTHIRYCVPSQCTNWDARTSPWIYPSGVCSTLQHTAIHCNILQHTHAMHCNTLQHTATHCNTLQHTATHCNTLRHTHATHRNALRHTATHCNTLQHAATRCNTLQHIHRHATHMKTHSIRVIWGGYDE